MKHASTKRLMGGSVALALGLFSQSVIAQYYRYPYLDAECPEPALEGWDNADWIP